jgi:putative aldouronate transport system permease protein
MVAAETKKLYNTPKNTSPIKETFSDRVFNVVNYSFLTIVLMVVLYPLIYIVSASLSAPEAIVSGRVWLWPVDFSLEGYVRVFNSSQIWVGYKNSLIYTILGTSINIVVTIMAAYPLSRKDFYGKGLITFIFTFTMLFHGGLIPRYLVIKNLGMLDTRWAMVIPQAMAVWNVIIMRTYFKSNIPEELNEAAELDGCRDTLFIVKVVLPLSGPIVAVMVLFYAVTHWNSYFDALIFLRKANLYPLQIILRNILVLNEMDPEMFEDQETQQLLQNMKDLMKYSVIIVASAPVLAIYPFVQKYFVRGIMIGALKG